MMVVLIVYVFLYGRLYLALSGVEKAIMKFARSKRHNPLEAAMASQSIVQIGLLMALPMVMEMGLERGFRTALGDIIIMQLQLAPVFFTSLLGQRFTTSAARSCMVGRSIEPLGEVLWSGMRSLLKITGCILGAIL